MRETMRVNMGQDAVNSQCMGALRHGHKSGPNAVGGRSTSTSTPTSTSSRRKMRSCSTVKMPYKNPLFKNLSPYPGGIHQIQVASTLRTLGYPSFCS